MGAASGVAGSAFTANPAVGYAIGISMQAATNATVKYVMRTWTHEQQQLMADIAGTLPLNQSHSWEVSRMIPYGNERGQLQVVREINNALTSCREVLFSIEPGDSGPVTSYITAICENEGQWAWATVDPSVNRWWGLQ